MKHTLIFSLLVVLMVSVSVVSVSAAQDPPTPPTPTPIPTPQPKERCSGEVGQGIIINDSSKDIRIKGDLADGSWEYATLRPGQDSIADSNICDVDYISVWGASFSVYPSVWNGRIYNSREWSWYLWGKQRCVDRTRPRNPFVSCSTRN